MWPKRLLVQNEALDRRVVRVVSHPAPPPDSVMRLSDAALMRRVRDHDDARAFAALYDRYAATAHRVACSVCARSDRAEDVVQEAFVAIWRRRSTFRCQSEGFAAWALTIVRNRAIDAARAEAARYRWWHGDAALEEQPAKVDVESDAAAADAAARLRAVLAQLPEAQCEVIALAFYGQLTHREIAAHLGLPEGTVKGRMRSGLARLGGALACEHRGHGPSHLRRTPSSVRVGGSGSDALRQGGAVER